MSNLSTAFAIQDGISNVVFSDETMMYAARIAQISDFNPEVMNLLMKYASTLSAGVATKVVELVMPKSEFILMMDEIKELEQLDEEIM
jgi:hypothetical protein